MAAHKFRKITFQEVEVMYPHPSEGSTPIVIEVGEPDIGYGCYDCGMNLEDGLKAACPGKFPERVQ